jgi:hypothetical protein
MSTRPDLDRTQSTRSAFAITPSDSVVFDPPTNGLYIGSTGTIRVVHADDTDVTDYPVIVAGSVYPWAVKQVHAAGTTVTGIIGQVTART